MQRKLLFILAVIFAFTPANSEATPLTSFSSYSKGLHEVTHIEFKDQWVELTLKLPQDFQSKLEKRCHKLGCSALSIDGVYAEIIQSTPKKPYHLELVVKVKKNAFSNSSLVQLLPGNPVNIGMLSNNPKRFLLDSTFLSTVKLHHVGVAKGHRHTRELIFECSEDTFKRIQGLQYVGLNASGLLLRDPRCIDGRYYFSIHAGRRTRETTIFGQEHFAPNIEFTLTFPFHQ